MTRNLAIFTAVAAVFGLAFHSNLTRLLLNEEYGWIPFWAAGYALGMFAAGFGLGRMDRQRATRADLGFQYHLLTFAVTIPIWGYFHLGRVELGFSPFWLDFGLMAIWTLILLVHWRASTRSIKGMRREEVFD
jgi:hypothetical protein